MWKCCQCETNNDDAQAVCEICGLSRIESLRLEKLRAAEAAARPSAPTPPRSAAAGSERREPSALTGESRPATAETRDARTGFDPPRRPHDPGASRDPYDSGELRDPYDVPSGAHASTEGTGERTGADTPKRSRGKELTVALILTFLCLAVVGAVIGLLVKGSREDPALSGYTTEYDEPAGQW